MRKVNEKNKEWLFFNGDNCPNCGNNLEALTGYKPDEESEFEQWFYEDEEVRCSGSCGFKSTIIISDEKATIADGNIDELLKKEKQK